MLSFFDRVAGLDYYPNELNLSFSKFFGSGEMILTGELSELPSLISFIAFFFYYLIMLLFYYL